MPLYIGLLSGTSMDGIDAAVVDVDSHQLIAGITKSYKPEILSRLQEMIAGNRKSLASIATLNALLGQEFAETVLELLKVTKLSPNNIIAIGSHGQTILHNPKSSFPHSIQLGCPHTIVERTGITVVADFRTRDLVVGGQGAPFAPIYHQALFQNTPLPLAVINIGGIANISYLETKDSVLGFDTGPGNCLMDHWIKMQQNKSFDKNGDWARSGMVLENLLTSILLDPFFHEPYPKSIDKAYFSLQWLAKFIENKQYKPVDIQATLLHLTAKSIAKSVLSMPEKVKNVFICGGGAHNACLLEKIGFYLPGISVQSTQNSNISPDYMEAMLFAWLADKTITKQEVDLRKITGAKRPTILGAIYPV